MEWQCFSAALFSLEDGSTTAKRPRRHPTWRRAVPVWRNRTRRRRRLDAYAGPDPSQALPGESFSMGPNANVHHLVSLILTTSGTDQIAHDLVLADLRLWVIHDVFGRGGAPSRRHRRPFTPLRGPRQTRANAAPVRRPSRPPRGQHRRQSEFCSVQNTKNGPTTRSEAADETRARLVRYTLTADIHPTAPQHHPAHSK